MVETFFFDGSDESLGISVEVWRPGRQLDAFYPAGFEYIGKMQGKKWIPIMDQVFFILEQPGFTIGNIAGYLSHPLAVRVVFYAQYRHFAS